MLAANVVGRADNDWLSQPLMINWADPLRFSNPMTNKNSLFLCSLLALLGLGVAAAVAPAQAVNLINSDFENGLTGWSPYISDDHADLQSSDDAFSGNLSCLVCNRQHFWAGIQQDLITLLTPDVDYRVRFSVKSASDSALVIKSEIRQVDDRGITYHEIGKVLATPDDWTEFVGGIRVQANGQIQALSPGGCRSPGIF